MKTLTLQALIFSATATLITIVLHSARLLTHWELVIIRTTEEIN